MKWVGIHFSDETLGTYEVAVEYYYRGQWEKPSAETVKSRVALQANRRLFFMGLNDHNFVIEKRWQKHIVHPSCS